MKFVETESIELKERLNDSFTREVVSFLNTHNGTIYIGVTDKGEVIGVDNVDKTLRLISNIIVDCINPSCKEYVKPIAIIEDGKLIIKVEVSKGKDLYYIKSKGLSELGCFIRVGSSCRGLNDNEIKERYEANLNISEPKLVNQETLRTDLTFRILKSYLANQNIHVNDDTFLKNFNLLTPSGKFNKMAEILSDDNMNSIKVAVFKGKDKSYFLKRNEYGNTCLLSALEKVLNYCDALNETYVDLSVSPRREKKMFNFEAFKEAWINACVHNKWTDGYPPAVYWYDDRLEIVSNGGIPKGMTQDEFLAGKTKPVNEELMNIFLQCNIVEHSGHGVPVIVREYGKQAYEFSESFITVTIPFDKTGFDRQNVLENQNVCENVHQNPLNTIMKLIEDNPQITLKEMAKAIGKTEKTVQRLLKNSDSIEYVGSSKKGYWTLKRLI